MIELIEKILPSKRKFNKKVENIANKKNPLIGVTGMLFCNSEGYLQVLEGPRVNVSNLFLKISQDTRHKDPMLISVEDIQNLQRIIDHRCQ